MQIFFIFTLLSTIIAFNSAPSAITESIDESNSMIVAEQMQQWHLNAVEKCYKSACNTGFVIPNQAHLSNIDTKISEATTPFITWFDLTTGWIMTHPSNDSMNRANIAYGSLSAELSMLNKDLTTHLGIWNAKHHKVNYFYHTEFAPKLTILMATHPNFDNLEDGIPLLISHIAP